MENKSAIPTKNPPQVFSIQELPDFVKGIAERIWQKYGTPKNHKDVIFTFHKGIYTLRPLTQDVFVHEAVHYARQGAGENEELAKQYLERYADDDDFRLSEEILAYRAQYDFVKRRVNKPQAFDYAKRLATDLSGPMYGNIISFGKALNAIIA